MAAFIRCILMVYLCIVGIYSFMKPPPDIIESTILSSSSSRSTSNNAFNSEIWHQPKFNDEFTSYWYYWQSIPGQITNEDINYGTVKWIFNKTHMYYHFNIPSLNTEFHQFVINDTLYVWKQNNSEIDCYSYKFSFDIIENYFLYSSFAGLTDSPDIGTANDIYSQFDSISLLQNNSNTTTPTSSPTDSPTHSPSDSPTSSPTDSPTSSPTDSPTSSPSDSPTSSPTDSPTSSPTDSPTSSPTDSPTSSPSDSPTSSPTHSPTDSPTSSPTHSPTDSPTSSPTDSPTSSPTDSPTSSPTDSPTSSPSKSPTGFYPMEEAEAIWIGYIFTERIFGRNLTYIVTANQSGSIGHLYITLNTDNNINLKTKVSKSEIMWLQNITWNVTKININLPNQCKTDPINIPTMSPTASPIQTISPSISPTISGNIINKKETCHLPQTMIVIYVVLITFFLLLLFCWYARKNSMISRMINGNDQSIGISSGGYHNYNNNAYNNNNYNNMNNMNNNNNKYNPMNNNYNNRNNKILANNNNNNNNQYRSSSGYHQNKQFIPRKTSDRYVGDEDSDIEYSNAHEKYRKLSKVSSMSIDITEKQNNDKKNKNNNNNNNKNNDSNYHNEGGRSDSDKYQQ